MNEIFVQSHYPGRLILLPDIPFSIPTGKLRGFIARGNIKIDLDWENRNLLSATLRFNTSHFWNNIGTKKLTSHANNSKSRNFRRFNAEVNGHSKHDYGFYEISHRNNEISIFTPNKVLFKEKLSCADEVNSIEKNVEAKISMNQKLKQLATINIVIRRYPCIIFLVADNSNSID